MFQIKTKIFYNKRIKGNYWRLAFGAPKIANEAWPGQFVNIKISNITELLLRRPFSIHRVDGTNIEILYEVLGPGTKILSQKKAAEYLDVIGSLGNGFNLCESTSQRVNESTIILGGGMGVAPLVFLAEKLMERKRQTAKDKSLVLIGAKTKNQILCEKEFKELGCSVKIATDDGSGGFKGKVTGLLEKFLRYAIRDTRYAIYACGPRPMLKEVSRVSRQYGIPAQISLEEHMACGIGACLGCVTKTKEGYKRVCKEGPVFDADEIIW